MDEERLRSDRQRVRIGGEVHRDGRHEGGVEREGGDFVDEAVPDAAAERARGEGLSGENLEVAEEDVARGRVDLGGGLVGEDGAFGGGVVHEEREEEALPHGHRIRRHRGRHALSVCRARAQTQHECDDPPNFSAETLRPERKTSVLHRDFRLRWRKNRINGST